MTPQQEHAGALARLLQTAEMLGEQLCTLAGHNYPLAGPQAPLTAAAMSAVATARHLRGAFAATGLPPPPHYHDRPRTTINAAGLARLDQIGAEIEDNLRHQAAERYVPLVEGYEGIIGD